MNPRRVRLLWCFVVLFALSTLPAFAADVRIVRLSLAQGDVQIDRNAGQGWEQAIVNMPVVAGARIYAAENSRAELEMEDGSSIRLAGPAQINITKLTTSADGNPVNVIQVASGQVYVNARLDHHDDFRIVTPTGESFAITAPSHLRFTVDQQTASLAVSDGEVAIQGGQKEAKVHTGETYNYILGQPDSSVRLNTVPPQPEDSWDQQRDAYNNPSSAAAVPYSGAAGDPMAPDADAPGAADLAAYGTYADQPGYGEVWQPNDVGPDWNPYDNGAWSYYPDWGWTFVSGYPWGWAPFYYGNWCYINGRGWWWRPGPWHGRGPGRFPGGFHPQPLWAGSPGRNFNAPHAPARNAAHTTVAVAGSHLSVGPIAATHAPGASYAPPRATAVASSSSAIHATAAHTFVGESTSGPTGRSAMPSASTASPHIVGRPGSYRVLGAGNTYQIPRMPGTAMRSEGNLARASGGGATAPRSFGYAAGSSIPSAPHFSAPASSAPHVSSSGGGGSFHGSVGGGGGGGGGSHGGGGGGGGGHR